MEGVKDIVSAINAQLEKSFIANSIMNFKLFGIAEIVKSGDAEFPVFFKRNDGSWAGINDNYHVIIYHRMESVSSREAGKGYGDSGGEMNNTYQMKMVVFFNEGAVKLKRDEMYAFLQSIIPDVLKTQDSKFTYIRSSVISAILNSQQVFQQEYKGISYSLKPEQSLISINYQIESRFKKGCFNCCSEG